MHDVLVIDSNQSIRKVLVAGLTGFGFSVIEADSYAEAEKQLIEENIPSVAIVDFTRDDTSARDFLNLLRTTPDYQTIKVIVATVNTLSSEEQHALGVDAVMVKPLDLSQLVKAVYLFRRPTGKK